MSLGDLLIDLRVSVSRYPEIGGDVEVSRLERFAGGSAANFAVALARIGYRSAFIGKIGSDEDGQFLYEGLKLEGVDVSHVQFDERTGTVLVIVNEGGQRTMFSFRGAGTQLRHEEIDRDFITAARVLHVSGYALMHSPQREAALKAMEYAEQANVAVSLDPSPHIHMAEKESVARGLRVASLLFPDLAEARTLSGTVEPEEAADRLLRLGPKVIALKLGHRGCLIATSNQRILVPSFDVEVADTTGAGDAFDAGFVAGFLNGWKLKEAGEFANAVAALKITRKGARAGLPTLNGVENFLRKQREKRGTS